MNKSFSLPEKIQALEKIEQYFNSPEMDLEEAVKRHGEALKIAQEIFNYLEKAENSLVALEKEMIKETSTSVDELEDNLNEK